MTHQHQAYCQQLLLDCDDPLFDGPLFKARKGGPTKKMRDLANPRSEDAVTWSIFRLLDRHFGDQPWLSGLLALAGCDVAATGTPNVTFWEKGYPPQERLLWLLNNTDNPRMAESDGAKDDPDRLPLVRRNLAEYRLRIEQGKTRGKHKWVLEGATEFDAVIRCPGLLVAVEAKLYSDIATGVTWDTGRDQIARVIDVGLELAGEDGFVFLLVTDWRQHDPPKAYEHLMEHYRTNPPSGLSASRLGWLTWGEIYQWLERCSSSCTAEQGVWLDKLKPYLARRKLLET